MPLQSFQETRNELVSRLTTVYHRLRYQHLPLTTVGDYLLDLKGEISALKQIAETEVSLSDQQMWKCCIHRLNNIQIQLSEQALLLQGYPQGEIAQKCPIIFCHSIEMIAVQIGRCNLKSYPDRQAAHMELKASIVNSNLLYESVGIDFNSEIELKTLKDLWRTLNTGVPGCRCHQCLRQQFQV